MKIFDFSKLNRFFSKMTVLLTMFISSFFLKDVKYFNTALQVLVFLVLVFTLFVRIIVDIVKKRRFTKNFDMFLATVVTASIGKLRMSIITLFVYEFILYFEKNKIDNDVVLVKRGKKEESVFVSNIKMKDILILKRFQKLKVDCYLQSDDGIFLSNNKKIVELKKLDKVPAGYISLESDIYLSVCQKYKDSMIKLRDDILLCLEEEKDEYNYYSKIIRVIAIMLIFIPNLLTGVIEKRIMFIGASLLVVKDMKVLFDLSSIMLDSVIIKVLNNNILIKDSSIFRKLGKIKNIVFEKTGTLTLGEFRITDVSTDNIDKFFEYLNYGEYLCFDRIATVIKEYKKIDVDRNLIKKFREIPQRGVECRVNKENIVIGNSYFLKEKGIDFEKCYDTGTIIYLAVNKKCLGYLVISDSIDSSIKDVVNKLKKFGVKKFTVMSSDNEKITNAIAYTLGIKDKYSNLKTDEKIFWTNHLKENNKGGFLVVGNNETDEKFLALGDLSIVLSDNLVWNKGDILFMDKSLECLPWLFDVSRKYVKKLRRGRIIVGLYKVLCIILSVFGILPLWFVLIFDIVIVYFIVIGGRIYE